jgi:hypothetical protein
MGPKESILHHIILNTRNLYIPLHLGNVFILSVDIRREPIVVERRVKSSLLGNDATYDECHEQIKLYFEFINYVRKH